MSDHLTMLPNVSKVEVYRGELLNVHRISKMLHGRLELELETLELRRVRHDLVLICKVTFGLVSGGYHDV